MTKDEEKLAEINCSYQYEGGYHDGYEAAIEDVIKALEDIPEGNWANKRYINAVKRIKSAEGKWS